MLSASTAVVVHTSFRGGCHGSLLVEKEPNGETVGSLTRNLPLIFRKHSGRLLDLQLMPTAARPAGLARI
jgi:hypothetical protein